LLVGSPVCVERNLVASSLRQPDRHHRFHSDSVSTVRSLTPLRRLALPVPAMQQKLWCNPRRTLSVRLPQQVPCEADSVPWLCYSTRRIATVDWRRDQKMLSVCAPLTAAHRKHLCSTD